MPEVLVVVCLLAVAIALCTMSSWGDVPEIPVHTSPPQFIPDLAMSEDLDESAPTRDEIRAATYARAAFAVASFPHRIDRRAELVRHLLSLVDAPELGAATPNLEDDAQVETGSPVSPVDSAAPVLTATVGADEAIGVESGNEGRIDPMEGFL